MLIGVDDRRSPHFHVPGQMHPIGEMHMPVDEAAGLIAFDQPVEALEAPVGQRVQVVQMPRRGVGHQHVEASVAQQPRPGPADPAAHLLLGVEIWPRTVAVSASQPEEAQTLIAQDPPVQADAALRRRAEESPVVVAGDVKERAAGHGDQKLQIVPAQVSAGQDQVEVRQTARGVVFVIIARLHVGHGQDAHGAHPASPPRLRGRPMLSTVARPRAERSS